MVSFSRVPPPNLSSFLPMRATTLFFDRGKGLDTPFFLQTASLPLLTPLLFPGPQLFQSGKAPLSIFDDCRFSR